MEWFREKVGWSFDGGVKGPSTYVYADTQYRQGVVHNARPGLQRDVYDNRTADSAMVVSVASSKRGAFGKISKIAVDVAASSFVVPGRRRPYTRCMRCEPATIVTERASNDHGTMMRRTSLWIRTYHRHCATCRSISVAFCFRVACETGALFLVGLRLLLTCSA